MKSFWRGLLALVLIVSLAFNGAMYCALKERANAQAKLTDERDESLRRAEETEKQLGEQRSAAGEAQAQLALVQETLTRREAQLDELNLSLGQAVEGEQALKEALSDRQAEIEDFRRQVEALEAQCLSLSQERDAQAALAQSAETLQADNDGLNARLAELEKQLEESSFGQEDRVQAIAELQKQLTERGELLAQAQAEYERLEGELTRAEEKNAGQAVLIQESGQREQQALAQAQDLRAQLDALEMQLTQAEENYGGASATLSEQEAALESARQEIAALEKASEEDQALLAEQKGRLDALTRQAEDWAQEKARLEQENQTLTGQLAEKDAPLTFTGREIALTLTLPEGMLAAEYQGAVYLSRQEMQGVIREIPVPGSLEEFGVEQALSLVLDELFAPDELPPVTDLPGGYRFPGPESDAGHSEVCVLQHGTSLLYLHLEGPDSARLTETVDALLADLA